jgi:serine/threonine protein kinase
VDGTPFGRYRLVELIGRGGGGEVWRAYDTAYNNRPVAIKLLPPHLAQDERYVKRFRGEADKAAQLNNPHVIPIHNYGEIDGRLYVDMRLIEGHDLQEVLAGGPLEPGRAVRIIEQVAKALQAAHKIGLVHRDVKPSNILLDEDDFAYLIDFGIARGVDETRMTATGAMIGTWHYIAPERLRAREADARADIYALACVLYECLTGHPPFPGDSFESQIAAHLTDPPPRPSTTQPNVPAQFDAVIARGMAKNPDERYATTVELARDARDAITVPIRRPAPSPAARPMQQPPNLVSAKPPVVEDVNAWQRPRFPPRPSEPSVPANWQGVWAQPPYVTGTPQAPPSRPQQPQAAPPAMNLGAFVSVLAGVVLLSISIVDNLVPWRGATTGAGPGFLTGLLAVGTIPGIVLLVLGRGRSSPGKTIAGLALVVSGLSTLSFLLSAKTNPLRTSGNGALILGAIFAAAGLLLILIPMPWYRRSRAAACALLFCGLAILLMFVIDGQVMTVYRLWGQSEGGRECVIKPFEGISPGATLAYSSDCGYTQHAVARLLIVGAISGGVLVVAGVIGLIASWSAPRSTASMPRVP